MVDSSILFRYYEQLQNRKIRNDGWLNTRGIDLA